MTRILLTILIGFSLVGCSTHSDEQIAAVRASGVSSRTVMKLREHGSLSPSEIIELKRHGVSDGIVLRQLDKDGVDYVVQDADLKKLRAAKVSEVVIDALQEASGRFLADRYRPRHHVYYYDGYYGDPFWWPAVSIGIWGGHSYYGHYHGYSHGHSHGGHGHGHRH